MQQLPATQLATILMTCARLEITPPASYMSAYCALPRDTMTKSPPMYVKSLWAFAALGVSPDPNWFTHVLANLEPMLPQCNGHELSNIMYALAKLKWSPTAPFVEKALDRSLALLHRMDPQALANTLWSIAKMDISPDEVRREKDAGRGAFVGRYICNHSYEGA